MELLDNLGLGFATALSPWNLLYAFVGCLLGTAVGVLPGLGPLATIAMLLPLTFSLPPVSALIMLSGIYYGAQYGGSTTAILINLPGESSSVVTAIDGYQMAKNGRAGQALATAALGSFFAGSVATVILALFAPPLANVALEFGPAEYFSLMVLGLVASVALASGSLLKAFTMIVLGLLLGLVGTDVETGTPRFTFDLPEIADGLNFVALAMGVFGLGEIIRNLEHEHTRSVMVKSVSGLWLSKDDFRRSSARCCAAPAWARSWASCPAAGRCWPASPPTRWKSGSRPTGRSSARGRSRAWPHPRPRTMPGRRPRSSRC